MGYYHPYGSCAGNTVLVDNTPIDYLDFASPVSGWVQKWGWMPQTNGRAKPNASGGVLLLKILKLPARIDAIWDEPGYL
ncbi:3-polyprenyl-4-hydroxybenzoate carboxylyase [Salmonella enterica subsp. arizonae]|uniref:3-polyprenyl-4-hydroxybenzoate carboxylyase n=1 Tax=Salmonella enterica subsp. arizonae TaxID=59203 RepID=A0A379T341_SALER|nr:3-polyprenyl-4-hydroxybenzoate carboxylyase [Salmonella enterica subsp. arizonae]